MIGRMLLHVAFTPARRSCGRKPMTAKEIAWSIAAFALFCAILGALNHGYTAPTTAPMHGWYVGQDGSYYPDGFPVDRTQPKPTGAATDTGVQPAVDAGPTNWPLLAGVVGGVVLVLVALLWPYGRRKRSVAATTTRASFRPPPSDGPPKPWRPYGQPFDL